MAVQTPRPLPAPSPSHLPTPQPLLPESVPHHNIYRHLHTPPSRYTPPLSIMGDAAVQNRTIVLRILDPQMRDTLRSLIISGTSVDSIFQLGDSSTTPSTTASTSDKAGIQMNLLSNADVYAHMAPYPNEDATFWNFYMPISSSSSSAGGPYPCRLVNLPTLVELHKTTSHKDYTKAAEIGQMLVVYPDKQMMTSAERKKNYVSQDFPGYYHSGLSGAADRIVDRRFKMRREKSERFYGRAEVNKVEEEIISIMRDRLNIECGGIGNTVDAKPVRKKYKKKPKKGEENLTK
jgi:hypothetical protein